MFSIYLPSLSSGLFDWGVFYSTAAGVAKCPIFTGALMSGFPMPHVSSSPQRHMWCKHPSSLTALQGPLLSTIHQVDNANRPMHSTGYSTRWEQGTNGVPARVAHACSRRQQGHRGCGERQQHEDTEGVLDAVRVRCRYSITWMQQRRQAPKNSRYTLQVGFRHLHLG